MSFDPTSLAWRGHFPILECRSCGQRQVGFLSFYAELTLSFLPSLSCRPAMSVVTRYLVNNLPRLPTRAEKENNVSGGSVLAAIASMTFKQHLIFFSALLCWMMDAFDFFSVSLTVTKLTAYFHRETATVTLSITLTLLFRSVGALIFGLLSDRYGRKYPLVVNMIIIAALSLGTAFVKTWPQFLAVRSLFGIAMGGIWGPTASYGLENIPVAARGLYSGIFQEGYAIGYLMAAVVNLTLVIPRDDWRLIFYVGAAISLFAAGLRLALPESSVFLAAKARSQAAGGHANITFFKSAGQALKANWLVCIYGILLMTGFNFFSHGSQDLYPTYLQKGKLLSAHQATIGTIIGNCGAIAGGVFAGALSQVIGRKITILVMIVWTAVFIPLWTLPSSAAGLWAGAFFVQVGVQGAWGVVPVLLNEMAPPAFRAVFGGLAYQLGNAASSASSQIEAIAGESLRTGSGRTERPDYAKIMQIFLGAVCAYLFVVTFIGPEKHGVDFENAAIGTQAGAGQQKFGDRRGTDDIMDTTDKEPEKSAY